MANGRGDDFTPLVRLMRTVNSIHYPTRFAQVFFSKKPKKFSTTHLRPILPSAKRADRPAAAGRVKFPIKVQLCRTFIPLPAPSRRGLVRRADERGLSPPVSPEPGAYLRGTASPLDLAQLRKVPVHARL